MRTDAAEGKGSVPRLEQSGRCAGRTPVESEYVAEDESGLPRAGSGSTHVATIENPHGRIGRFSLITEAEMKANFAVIARYRTGEPTAAG